MVRMARFVCPGEPHHVIQRGNRRQNVFFCDQDRKEYLRLLKEQSDRYGVKYWAYCLMSNHVHLIAVPEARDSLARAIGETHRRYTRMINFREGWRGYLWQGRFGSFLLGPKYLYYALRYVERNPVRAGLVARAEEYKWSSARSHVHKRKNDLVSECYISKGIKDWPKYLKEPDEKERIEVFHKHMCNGRPLGQESFIEKLEQKFGIILRKKKPGPKPRN